MRIEDFYRDVNADVVRFNKNDFGLIELDPEQLKFTKLVFAPDPLTGNPNSEISYILHGEDPQFQQWIKEKLFMPTLQANAHLAGTAEEAEALVKKNMCTPAQFECIVRDYVTNMMKEANSE